jgi:hypothetical protein
MSFYALIDTAVADALLAHADYLSPKGIETDRARKLIVRKVTKALRDAMSPPREDDDRSDAPEPIVAASDAAQPQFYQCQIWSREWWALFFATIERGQSVGFMLSFAMRSQKGTMAAIGFDRAPSEELIERMKQYPSTAPEVEAWRNWLARNKNVRLPEWRDRVWLFLPSPDPPEQESSAA